MNEKNAHEALSGSPQRQDIIEELQHNIASLSLLLQISETLAQTVNLKEILQLLTDSAIKIPGLDTSAIYLFKDEFLHLGATTPPLPESFPETLRRSPLTDHPHIQQVITTNSEMILPDALNAELTRAEREVCQLRRLRTLAYLPLKGRTGILGVLIIGTRDQPRQISEVTIKLCRTLGTHASIAIENSKHYQSVRDELSERKLAEAALHESNEMLAREQEFSKLLLDTIPAFIVAIGMDGKTILMNKAMLEALEYKTEEVFHADYLKTFVPEEEREKLAGVFQQFISGNKASWNENRIVRKSGKTYLLEWHGRSIPSLGSNPGFFIGIGIDITERRKTEEVLQQKIEELQRFHRLVVNHELVMIELKMEVNELLRKAQQPEKYLICSKNEE